MQSCGSADLQGHLHAPKKCPKVSAQSGGATGAINLTERAVGSAWLLRGSGVTLRSDRCAGFAPDVLFERDR